MPTTPLRRLHEDLGARFTEFAGWEMPLRYEGTVAEHLAVRKGAGVFDVSHLGRFRVQGAGATDLLRRMLCNDITKIQPGRAQYTMALNEDGGVEDDIIVWRIDDEDYWVLPNGANFDGILRRFGEEATASVDVEPVRDETVLLAVQGGEAPAIIEDVVGAVARRFRVVEDGFGGGPCWVAGTGYTGEPGGEVAVPVYVGERLLRELVAAGATPCGLGARDTLRLEMGYPLWGQDLDTTTTPLEAGLEWVVAWDHDFVGRPALEKQREAGVDRELVGFRLQGRRIARTGSPLRVGDSVGAVTSGGFSPVLGGAIGMGYVAPPTDSATASVEIRGTWHDAIRTDPPFVDLAVT